MRRSWCQLCESGGYWRSSARLDMFVEAGLSLVSPESCWRAWPHANTTMSSWLLHAGNRPRAAHAQSLTSCRSARTFCLAWLEAATLRTSSYVDWTNAVKLEPRGGRRVATHAVGQCRVAVRGRFRRGTSCCWSRQRSCARSPISALIFAGGGSWDKRDLFVAR
jgi:hypothetical protein